MENLIFDMLSEPLKKSLLMESNKIVLKFSPIFRNNFNEKIIEKTVPKISEINFPPEENIFLEGSDTNDVYFI